MLKSLKDIKIIESIYNKKNNVIIYDYYDSKFNFNLEFYTVSHDEEYVIFKNIFNKKTYIFDYLDIKKIGGK